MKLSIIVPLYRVERELNRCIESIVGQDYEDFELLLIDDGSPDACPQMCDDWAVRDRRIRVYHQLNGGLSEARNTGIDHARGEYITFVDSDDYLAAGTLRALMAILESHPEYDLLEYPLQRLRNGKPMGARLKLGDTLISSVREYWLDKKAYEHSYAVNKIYRRRLFDTISFPKGRVFEDIYTLTQLLELNPCIATTSKGCYYYCWNDEGITAKADGHALAQLLEAQMKAPLVDDCYYMHMLNVQLDVFELTGAPPVLPMRRVHPLSPQLSSKYKIKAIILNLMGIKNLCKLSKLIHKTVKLH